ncbi:MAG: hypothetical protein ACREXX_00620, partial [Gammaproteobacteria bacterium]
RFIKPKGSTPLSIEKRSLPENRKGSFARLCKARYCDYDRSPILQRTVAGDWVTRNAGTSQRLRGLAVKTGGTVTLLTNTLRLALSEFFAVGTNGQAQG